MELIEQDSIISNQYLKHIARLFSHDYKILSFLWRKYFGTELAEIISQSEITIKTVLLSAFVKSTENGILE